MNMSDDCLAALVRLYKVTCVTALSEMVGMDGTPNDNQLDASIEAGVRAVAEAVGKGLTAAAWIEQVVQDYLGPPAAPSGAEPVGQFVEVYWNLHLNGEVSVVRLPFSEFPKWVLESDTFRNFRSPAAIDAPDSKR